ncbi:NAD(P)H-binding protein [Streptomyces parvulus]|uniref:SDR family NAD(P)-dependent oxidoreductase n=1 Tax=Streptomyces parvulus TaxID=146923 RepID=A0A369V0A6_9ACTN|nr:NAD(P)H-binding protein [Streptomyces parvulus]RDD83989.1 SDR family NAD(P)-dependent oxidoreductase [Streptomyces parvulus]
MTLAITGASGPLGRAATRFALEAVDPKDLVLTTRNPEALADLAGRGADVRRVDFNDPLTLAAAFKGVDRLVLISTDVIGRRLEQQRAAVRAAADAGVRQVVYTSVPEPVPGNPAVVVADHAGTEQALRDSGLRWTMLRNNLYAHMQVPVIQRAAAEGRLVTNSAPGATAYVSREDCAAVAAAVLTGGGHEDRAYDVTGPTALTAADLAVLASEIGGREVELVHVDDEAYAAGLRAAGLPAPVADLVTTFGASAREGFLSTVSSAVSDLAGRQPTSLAEIVRAAPAA